MDELPQNDVIGNLDVHPADTFSVAVRGLDKDIARLKEAEKEPGISKNVKEGITNDLTQLQGQKQQLIREEMNTVGDRISEHRKDVSELHEEIATLKEEKYPHSGTTSLIQSKEKEIEELEKSIKSDEKHLNTLMKNNPEEALHVKISETSKALSEVSASLQEDINEYNVSYNKESSLRQQLLTASESDKPALLEEIRKERNIQTPLILLIMQKQNDFANLSANIPQEQGNISPRLQANLDDFNSKLQVAQANIDEVVLQLDIKYSESEVKDKVAAIAILEKDLKSLHTAIDRRNLALGVSLPATNLEQKQGRSAVQAEALALRKESLAKQQEINKLSDEVRTIQAHLDEMNQRMGALQVNPNASPELTVSGELNTERLTEADTDVSSLRSSQASLDVEEEISPFNPETLKEEIEASKRKISDLMGEISQVNLEITRLKASPGNEAKIGELEENITELNQEINLELSSIMSNKKELMSLDIAVSE